MGTEGDLGARLARMLAGAREEGGARRAEREREAAERSERERLCRALATQWLDEIVLPTLGVLAGAFPNASAPKHEDCPPHASLAFRPDDEFPVGAHFHLSLAHDPDVRRIEVRSAVTILPILMDFEKGGEAGTDLLAPDRATIERFLDERVERFAADYLRTREPGSPYLKDLLVTDPVCGARFPRGEAAGSVEREGRRVFFCSEVCRARFGEGPGCYERR